MTKIDIDNIVCFINLHEPFDIEFLSEKIPDAIYNPEEFDGLSIRYETKKIATIVLSNGKIICTGAKDFESAEASIKETIEKINNTGLKVEPKFEIEIENIVASTNLYKDLDLSAISTALIFQGINYKPEEFPGLIYKIKDTCIVILIFASGKIVCIGAKSIDEAEDVINQVKEKLSSIGV